MGWRQPITDLMRGTPGRTRGAMRLRVHSHHPRTPTPVSTNGAQHGGASHTSLPAPLPLWPFLMPLFTQPPNRTRDQSEYLPPEHLALLMHGVHQEGQTEPIASRLARHPQPVSQWPQTTLWLS